MSRIHYHHNLAYLSDARLIGITCRAFVHLHEYECAIACADLKSTRTVCILIGFWWRKLFLVLFIFSFHSFACWSVESVWHSVFNECASDMNMSVRKSRTDEFVYRLRCYGRCRRHHRHCYRCCSMMMMMMTAVCACVCSLLSVQAIKPKPNGFRAHCLVFG